MPISLQADTVLPRGYVLIDNQRVVNFSLSDGLSANILKSNITRINDLSASVIDTETLIGTAGQFLIPVGSIMAFPANTNPTGWLKLNGAELVRNSYSRLWNFAQTSGNIVSEASWSSSLGSFSTGNGSSTFRIPDLRGEFVRGWADGKTVVDESTRVIGSNQADIFKTHNHSIRGGSVPVGGPARLRDLTHEGNNSFVTNSNSDGGGNETRPRNVALLYCIKF
jgi:microcystin-dependent protein